MKKYIFLFFALVCFVALQGQTPDVAITTDTATAIAETVNYSVAATGSPTAIKQTVWQNLLGGLDLADYISAFLFAFVGLFLRHRLIVVRKAIKNNPDTPNKFNWAYWFKNNFMTKLNVIWTNIAVIFVMLRFSFDWFGVEVSMVAAFVLGLSIDWAYDFIRKLQKKVPDATTNNNPPTPQPEL